MLSNQIKSSGNGNPKWNPKTAFRALLRIAHNLLHKSNRNLFILKKFKSLDSSLNSFLIFVTETISRTDEGQPRPKYIVNNSINVELTSTFYSTEVWSITITEFQNLKRFCQKPRFFS